MKILLVIDKFPTLSETFVLDQVTGLIDRGHDVRIVSWAAKGDTIKDVDVRYGIAGRAIEMSPHVPRSLARRYATGAAKWMGLLRSCPGRALRLFSLRYGRISLGLAPLYVASALERADWTPDAVVAHFGTNGLIVSALKHAGFIPRPVPCYTFFHAYEISGLVPGKLSKAYRPMMDDGSVFLPISRLWHDKLRDAGVSPDCLRVCRMGVDTKAIPFRRRVIDPRRLRIVTVGRLVEKKAHEYSIRAVAEMTRDSGCDVQYDIIGAGSLRDELQALIDHLGAGENIHLLGAMPHSDVKAALERADVFLLPSVTSATGDMEGIPVSLMEAMASGLICVSTYHSGIPELIDDHVTGYLCRERNVGDIKASLTEIISAPQPEIDRMTIAARDKVVREYDQGKLIDDFAGLLTSR